MNSKTEQVLELTDDRINIIRIQHDGKTIAFVGTIKGLGVVIKGEAGYRQIPLSWFRCDSWDRSQTYADQLNQYALKISEEEAKQITCSSLIQKIYGENHG